MKTQATINGMTITAKEWKKNGQHRIYFNEQRRNGAQACWDVNAEQWVKVKGEFGGRQKDWIVTGWGL